MIRCEWESILSKYYKLGFKVSIDYSKSIISVNYKKFYLFIGRMIYVNRGLINGLLFNNCFDLVEENYKKEVYSWLC